MTDTQQQYAARQLTEIRALMESSSRFLSLSGLSGILVGLIALAGAAAAWFYSGAQFYSPVSFPLVWNDPLTIFLFADGMIVLSLALSVCVVFTIRKSKRSGYSLRNMAAKHFLVNLLVPLAAGGVFSIYLAWAGLSALIAPVTLIFYGLALINAGKYTLSEIRFLGFIQTALGLIACFFSGYGLFFWAFGFGFLHIFYGVLMHYRYDSKR
jgi:predicted lysophospholipase L1 biosynthesis ABC-type transport system permease subunit